MAGTILMVAAIILAPWLMIWLTKKHKAFDTLGAVFLSYAAGLLLSFVFKWMHADLSLAETVSSVLVLIAMPLILFSSDLKSIKKLAKPMLSSFVMDIAAVVLAAAVGFVLFKSVMPTEAQAAKIAGMLIGTYTGGTPNMISIGKALNAGDDILLSQTADMMAGGIYFLLLLSFLPKLLGKFLPEYKPVGLNAYDDGTAKRLNEKGTVKSYALIIALAIACVLVAMAIALVLPSKQGKAGLDKMGEFTAVIMLVVTTLGIALSFSKRVREMPGSYNAGQYFILMFSVAMGLCFDLKALAGAMMIFAMLLFVQFGAVVVHVLLAKLFKIDRDTMLITSTAGVFGPAFIIPIANKLKNDEIIVSGLICGILGYAIGNYLGIGLGEILLTICK